MFVEDAEKTLNEHAEDATKEINAEDSVSSADKEKALQEQKGVAELEKDPDFLKAVPKEFHKNPVWKKEYWEKKQAQRERDEYKTKTTEFEQKVNDLSEQLQSLQSAGDISEEQLNAIARQKGYQLTKEQAKEEIKDELEGLFEAATPEERAWWGKYNKALFSRLEKSMGQVVNPMSEFMVEYRLDKSEQQAKKYIEGINEKHGLKLNFEKDIEPELRKIIKNNPNLNLSNTNILSLTREYLAEKGIELGKKLSEENIKKQNEDKKKANMETGIPAPVTGDEYDGKSLQDILKSEYEKAGVSKFH
jgi:hypothetical protein